MSIPLALRLQQGQVPEKTERRGGEELPLFPVQGWGGAETGQVSQSLNPVTHHHPALPCT